MASPNDTAAYIAALQALDTMERELADGFETEFVVSNLARIAQYGEQTRFSDKQKKVIQALVEDYLGEAHAKELLGQMRLV